MGFVFQPYLSRGTATPCVARTMIQTADLVQAFPLDEAKKKEIIEISHDVMLKLIACLDEAEPIIKAVEQGKATIASGVKTNPAGTAMQLPAVTDLRAHVEGFLYNVKAALREIARLFGPFYGQKFDHRFQKIRKWAEATYGPDDPLTAFLHADAAWIERVIGMRNAVDHPGSGAGTLFVEDFKVVGAKPALEVSEPMWRLDSEVPSAIASDMAVIVDNLLTLFEDLITDALTRLAPNGPIVIYEVPAAERNPKMPVRYRVGLNEASIKQINDAAARAATSNSATGEGH